MEVNLTVLKKHVIGFDPRNHHVRTMSWTNNFCSCYGGAKVQWMTSVNTNCSFRHVYGPLQLFLLKELEVASGRTGYGSDKMIFFMICTLSVFRRHL